MGIWKWIAWRRPELSVAEIARKAATLVIESVRPLVDKRVATMGIHEARGYVRARAGHLIEDAIAMVTAHDRDARRLPGDTLVAATVEQLLPTLMRRPIPARVPAGRSLRAA